MRRAVSAGGLVVDERADGRLVLLIAGRNAQGLLQWTLPKGGLEDGESHAAAALREVREETGVACEIVDKAGIVDYWFVWHDEATGEPVRYHKFVHYFLMRPTGADPGARDGEAEDVQWVPIADAAQRLSHANEQALVADLPDAAPPGWPPSQSERSPRRPENRE